jgi:hypothetical protein
MDQDPTTPLQMPGPRSQPPERRRVLQWLSRWWDAGPWQKVALFAAIPLLLACACCSASLIFAVTPHGQQLARESQATQTAQAFDAAQATATAQQYALLHPAPTASTTATATQAATLLLLQGVQVTSPPAEAGSF